MITGATVTYIDHASGQTTTLANSDFDLRWPAYQGDATFEATLRPAGDDVNITGKLGTVAQFIDGGVSDMNAAVSAPGGTLSFQGRGDVKPELTGRLDADLQNTSQFLAALGLAGVDLPNGLGRAIKAGGEVTFTQDLRMTLRDGTVTLDHNAMNVEADIAIGGDKPRINAQLRAGALDFSDLASGNSAPATGEGGDAGAGQSTGTAVNSGWSKDPIDVSAISAIDGEVALVAEKLDFGTFNFGKTRILTTVENSRAVFGLRELQGYGGTMTGEFVANNRNGFSVGGDMSAKGINMRSVLADAAGITRFTTTGTAKVKFLGVGNSVDAIMKSLSGNASIRTGNGHISGFDLDKLMRSGNGTGGTTVFDSLSASFAMKDGQMFNNDLSMSMPLAKATGQGRIGLGNQDIDYTFTPALLGGDNVKGLAIPVRIHGPWSGPRFTPDLEKAIDLNLKEEKKKLKKKAKKEAEELLKKELGKGAGKELLKLFD